MASLELGWQDVADCAVAWVRLQNVSIQSNTAVESSRRDLAACSSAASWLDWLATSPASV